MLVMKYGKVCGVGSMLVVLQQCMLCGGREVKNIIYIITGQG